MAQSLLTEQLPWTPIGSWTAAAAATPAVAARAYGDVESLAGAYIFTPRADRNAIEIRFTGSTDGHSLVFDLMACRGNGDYFTRIATITCTVGTMQKGSASVLFVDTIVLSNTAWPTAKIEAISDAGNYAAKVWLDGMGYAAFALVATTINGTATAEYSGV